MKTVKMSADGARPQAEIDVDALLAAINEISESNVQHAGNEEHPQRVCVDGREWHSYRELADAFELDIRDFSVNEINR
ncbi:YodD family peroxide/acid resistance protein [Cedecea davisae]|uniref:YodD family peroxide/acid resistance protein n=1 Tax=Cedecea davisae TaxID=158484 RepID=UPI00242F3DE9|nr:YodD family peroxide/acid resistance protein [Cedecea davisae]